MVVMLLKLLIHFFVVFFWQAVTHLKEERVKWYIPCFIGSNATIQYASVYCYCINCCFVNLVNCNHWQLIPGHNNIALGEFRFLLTQYYFYIIVWRLFGPNWWRPWISRAGVNNVSISTSSHHESLSLPTISQKEMYAVRDSLCSTLIIICCSSIGSYYDTHATIATKKNRGLSTFLSDL